MADADWLLNVPISSSPGHTAILHFPVSFVFTCDCRYQLISSEKPTQLQK